ncbi:MAG: hypothetical protein WA359_12225 [Acidimicrobiales bacterium]
MSDTHSSAEGERASRYLRWYPRAWKERYGEEFVAHLEAELNERPVSMARSMNIALHGVTTRFKLQSSLRWVSAAALVIVAVAALIAVLASLENRPGVVPLSLNTGGSIGVPVSPKTVTDVGFQFTDHSTKRIRVTKVALINFRNYDVPKIVRVQFDPKRQGKNFLLNPSRSTPGLLPAINKRLLLGNGDSFVVSLRAPLAGRLYAVDGLRLTYVRSGHTHVTNLLLKQSPQLLCVESHVKTDTEPPACNREFTTAWSLAQFYEPVTRGQTTPQREALLATDAAFNTVTGSALRDPGLSEVRVWATSLFAHRGVWHIVQVTARPSGVTVLSVKNALLFRFDVRNRSTGATSVVCVVNGGYDSHDGREDPSLSSCAA